MSMTLVFSIISFLVGIICTLLTSLFPIFKEAVSFVIDKIKEFRASDHKAKAEKPLE